MIDVCGCQLQFQASRLTFADFETLRLEEILQSKKIKTSVAQQYRISG